MEQNYLKDQHDAETSKEIKIIKMQENIQMHQNIIKCMLLILNNKTYLKGTWQY